MKVGDIVVINEDTFGIVILEQIIMQNHEIVILTIGGIEIFNPLSCEFKKIGHTEHIGLALGDLKDNMFNHQDAKSLTVGI